MPRKPPPPHSSIEIVVATLELEQVAQACGLAVDDVRVRLARMVRGQTKGTCLLDIALHNSAPWRAALKRRLMVYQGCD